MKIGKYQSQVREDKQHKGKRIEAGPHVMLDQERCILCTRCTRFVDDVTKTHELGIFRRGHEERIELTPGMTLDNAYSGNVVDICPVGALTDRDFRYKVRVWYLDKTDSICPGCSRGCSISVHTNTIRPWHNDGKRVARLKPRLNPDVNGYWMCDDGRYGFGGLDADRLGRVLRLSPQKQDVSWETAAEEIAARFKEGGVAIVASGMLSNEDWAAAKTLFSGRAALFHGRARSNRRRRRAPAQEREGAEPEGRRGLGLEERLVRRTGEGLGGREDKDAVRRRARPGQDLGRGAGEGPDRQGRPQRVPGPEQVRDQRGRPLPAARHGVRRGDGPLHELRGQGPGIQEGPGPHRRRRGRTGRSSRSFIAQAP